MFSAKLIVDLHHILCAVRESCTVFGGVQLICSGDFYQLLPVPSVRYMDAGEFAFLSPLWVDNFHKVELTEVHRQKNETMSKVYVY